MTVKSRAGLNCQHVMQHVSLDAGRARKGNGIRLDLSDHFTMDKTILGDDRAVYPPGLANGKSGAVDVSGKRTINLNFTVTGDIPRDLHPHTEDRRRARGPPSANVFIL